MTTCFFQRLYSADANVCPDELLSLIDPMVLDEVNTMLCRNFPHAEIVDALF
jgi:hypothetical protein